MAERRQLHSGWTHVAMRVLFAGVATIFVVAGTAIARESGFQPTLLLAMIPFVVFLLFVARIVFRTQPLWVDGDFLEVGWGKQPRRVHCLDVEAVRHPSWSFRDDRPMLPKEVTVRGGTPIFFFPGYGAEDLIFGARRHARDLAEGRASFE